LSDDLHRVGGKEDSRGDGQRPLGAFLEPLEPVFWSHVTAAMPPCEVPVAARKWYSSATGQTLTVTGRTFQLTSTR
jgi:hypothetical protein